MQQLKDKIILLTGGSMGIGHACALKYAEGGAKVVVAANDRGSLDHTMEILGMDHLGIFCDVTNADDVKEAVRKTLQRYGRIDAIHNNAGIAQPSKPLHETSEAEWQQVLDTNLKSVFHTCRFGIEALKQTKGSILNTSSLVGTIGQENHAAYSATKGAMDALTKSMAIDYAAWQIRVNAVAPAGVWTPMLRKWSREQSNGASGEDYLNNIHLLGYCPEADVIADACVFLLSDKARFITGHIMPVSGGAELGYRKVMPR
ncbi:SDR family oxidoreductase [Chitinophaga sp. YIM B06452]|uniref:SDR family NAD(P)-dependent oxidoreductase n=1 Tax=Chitinophaga sp. YIM B06452 TaxID=3082158 RepID=UPI0031FE45DF